MHPQLSPISELTEKEKLPKAAFEMDSLEMNACMEALEHPLTFVDPACDLDAVLRMGGRSVVEAIRILCPEMPGS